MHDKRKILDMVQNGTISAAEAAKLLEAVSAKTVAAKASKIIFQVMREGESRPKVNISIPLKLAKIGVHFLPKNSQIKAEIGSNNFDFSTIDWKEILDMATSGETGELFYMEVDDENGKQLIIKISVE